MIRAFGAESTGFSAKVEPPAVRIRSASGNLAHLRMPGDIIRVAPEPFPHEARPINTAKGIIIGSNPPTRRKKVARLPRHDQACSAMSIKRLTDPDAYVPSDLACPSLPQHGRYVLI